MHGQPGDHIVVETQRVGTPARRGEILEVLHGPGGDRFKVRWDDDHESVYFPAPGAHLESP